MIEPSVTYGNQYLDLTRELSGQFKSSAPPSAEEKTILAAPPTPRPTLAPIDAPPPPTATPGPSPTPTPTPIEFAAYRTTGTLRVRSGPGTDYDVMDQVPENFVLDILGRSADNQWLAIAYPDFGSLGWVSSQFVTPSDSFDQFPVELAPSLQDSTPTPTPFPGFMSWEELLRWY